MISDNRESQSFPAASFSLVPFGARTNEIARSATTRRAVAVYATRSTAASCKELLSPVRLATSDPDVGDVIALEKISFPAAASRTENGKLPTRGARLGTERIPRILVNSCAMSAIIQNSKIKHKERITQADAPIDSPLSLASRFSLRPTFHPQIFHSSWRISSVSEPSRMIESAGEKSRFRVLRIFTWIHVETKTGSALILTIAR